MSKNNLTNYPENDWRDYLSHSYKGTTWGKHKYIAIKNGRYIYPKDSSGSTRGIPNENQVVKDDEYYQKAAMQSLSGVNYPLTNEIVNKRAEELKARDQQNEKKKKTAKNIGNKVKGALSLTLDVAGTVTGVKRSRGSSSSKPRSRKKKVSGYGTVKKGNRLGTKKQFGSISGRQTR